MILFIEVGDVARENILNIVVLKFNFVKKRRKK